MKNYFILLLFFITLVASGSNAKLKPKDISVKDFFKADTFSQPKLSPNGKYIAVISPIRDVPNLVLFEADGLKNPTPLTGLDDDQVRSFFWANDETIIFIVESYGQSYFNIYSVNISGKIRVKRLMGSYWSRAGLRYAKIVNYLKNDPNHILISFNGRAGDVRDILKLPVDSSWNYNKEKNYRLQMIERNSGNIDSWFFDDDGNVRAAFERKGGEINLLYKKVKQKKFNKIKTWGMFDGNMIPIGFDDENESIIVKSNLEEDKYAIRRFSTVTKTFTDLIYQNSEHEIINSDSYKDGESAKLKFVKLNSPIPNYIYFKPSLKKLSETLEPLFPQKKLHIVSSNKENGLYIIKAVSDIDVGTYYLYDKTKGTVSYLMHKNIALKPELMSPMKPFQFVSRDGVQLNGFITLPKGSIGKNLPLIINPHGGPFGIFDQWKFNRETQFLASRGYAVAQVNFRGSGGYGKKFIELGFGEKWGAEMQNDISDTVEHFIDKGIADQKRICIYGASYGGYAAMAGLTFTPNLYACGINYVGVTDLKLLFEKSDFRNDVDSIHWLKTVLVNPENISQMEKISPLYHLDKIQSPLMVIHGFHDRRVHRDNAIALKDKLEELGKPLSDDEWIMNLKEGHGFYRLESKIELYTKMEKFLAKNLSN